MIVIYLASIILVNYGFANTVPIETPLGLLPPMTFLVGVVFVLRDYVQQKIGHKVIFVMIIGCAISWYMASPVIATASMTAFIVSELVDWLIFTTTKGNFHKRVLLSSVGGVFVDTIIFLPMVGMFSIAAVFIMWASKMVAGVVVYCWCEK